MRHSFQNHANLMALNSPFSFRNEAFSFLILPLVLNPLRKGNDGWGVSSFQLVKLGEGLDPNLYPIRHLEVRTSHWETPFLKSNQVSHNCHRGCFLSHVTTE
jgi:hypothetical protein